jgi:hypothetical protein
MTASILWQKSARWTHVCVLEEDIFATSRSDLRDFALAWSPSSLPWVALHVGLNNP